MIRETDAPGPGGSMKLATLRDGSRDGRLVVVSQDVTQASDAHHVAQTLQRALDGWDRLAPHLDLIARGIESGGQPLERFHERTALAPLPRAYQWIAATPEGLIQRASDRLLDPRATLDPDGPAAAVEIGLAAILSDVPRGTGAAEAGAAIRLVVLYAWTEGGAFLSPVAASPGWPGGLSLPLLVERSGQTERREPGAVDFGALAAQAADRRTLGAGSLLSVPASGALVRLEPGDRLRIEMRDAAGHSVFGAIELQR